MSRSEFVCSHPMQFQRREGKALVKKAKRKMPVKIKQVLLAFGLAALVFFVFHEIYLFFISWKNLDVGNVQIVCSDAAVKNRIDRKIRDVRLGNILLLNISGIRGRIESDPWVKEVRIRKSFPSSVKIELTPRDPAALLQENVFYLIDKEGVELEKVSPAAFPSLPILFDERHFIEDRQEKIHLAWECLNSLSAGTSADVEMLDLSEPGNVVLKFRSGPTRLKLGDDLFAQKIALYRENKDRWENEFGVMAYMDFRIPDRIYLKTAEPSLNEKNLSIPDKEGR